MPIEPRDPTVCNSSDNMEGRGEMTTAPISLQDLRRKIYRKAKAEPAWRFWGVYVHVCKPATLREAYRLAHQNNGAPGSDGVTFAAIEADGVEAFLQLRRDELLRIEQKTPTNRPASGSATCTGSSLRTRPNGSSLPMVSSCSTSALTAIGFPHPRIVRQ